MHTEEQARKLWCPMVRVVEKYPDGNTSPRNTVVAINDKEDSRVIAKERLVGCQCIASGCAMWRWGSNLHACDEPAPTPQGYCGLAGKERPDDR